MLKNLQIDNVVLIEKAKIDFATGFCVLTGETGSGKSILLDALGLVIGSRSNYRLIGNNSDQSKVTAEFDISKNPVCQRLLRDNELIDSEDPNILRIRRILNDNSTSKSFINDNHVGTSLLAKIGDTLVEVHGQHDQRGLLNPASHLEIIDQYAANHDKVKQLKKLYQEIKEVETEIKTINDQKELNIREEEYLNHVIGEIESANIKPGELENLLKEKEQLSAREKISNLITDVKNYLSESSSNLINSQMALLRGNNIIENYLIDQKEEFEEIHQLIDQQSSKLDQKINILESILNEVNSSNLSLDEIQERIFTIKNLAKKLKIDSNEFDEFLEKSQKALKDIQSQEQLSHNLESQREEKLKSFHELAKEISQNRKQAAQNLAEKIEEELQFLQMPATKFLAEITQSSKNQEISPSGYEKISFKASINGGKFDAINKIASGGELSRFMLAIKVSLSNIDSAQSMIFDEIDTGIGGKTADAVGKRLKALAKNRQIFVVTHQPQIAAKADLHFQISKAKIGDKITTQIIKLDQENAKNEIARMISGQEVTVQAIEAAESLIAQG